MAWPPRHKPVYCKHVVSTGQVGGRTVTNGCIRGRLRSGRPGTRLGTGPVQTLTIRSQLRQQFIDLTDAISEAVSDWNSPAVLVYCPHTTAGILINEHADPDVARDVLVALDGIVPDGSNMYLHAEGNTRAHVKAILVGTSQLVPLTGGRVSLGRWQGIFLAEFDGPRVRQVLLQPMGHGP